MALFGRKVEHKAEVRAPEPEVFSAPPVANSPRRRYGIDDAIQLMRTLPLNQNTELILLVIRNTLASINVDLKEVIEDGAAKQERLRGSIANVASAIADLEREISVKKQEMAGLEADLAETTTVKERLDMAAQRDEAIAVPSVAASAPKPVPSARPKSPRFPPPPPPPPAPVASTGSDRDPSLEIEPISEPNPAEGSQAT